MRFFNRRYLLEIGDSATGDGLSINDLQVQFQIKKSVNNKDKVDKCSLKVYNLSDESLTYLETDYPIAIFSCGYSDSLIRLFYGEVTEVETVKNGTDRVTTINLAPSFSELTHKIISELVPEGGNIEDAFEAVRKTTSIAKGVYKGKNLDSKVVYGYPLTGTPRQMLNQISNAYNLQWKIESNVLYVNDSSTVESTNTQLAPVIGPSSGLIDRPYFMTGSDNESSEDTNKKSGVKFKALLNPTVTPGSLVRVDYKDTSEFYRVEEIDFTGDYRGSDWFMTCVCSKRKGTREETAQ